jgi:thiol:disulfide interchange protein
LKERMVWSGTSASWRAIIVLVAGLYMASAAAEDIASRFGPPAAATAATPTPPSGGPATHLPERTHASVEVTASAATAGGRRVAIRIVPEEGWHVYAPASSGTSAIGQGKPTIIAIAPATTVRVAAVEKAAVALATAPELAKSGAVEGAVALDLVVADAAAGTLEALLGFQTCSDESCDPPTGLKITAQLGDGPAAVTFAEARYGEAAAAPAEIRAAVQAAAQRATETPGSGSAAALSIPTALLYGLLGGLILNLMPCVLPVLGLKLMSFAQQSGRARQEVFAMNLWYCAGVFAVFFALATASVAANIGLASTNLAWGEQFTSATFNIAMLGIVFTFALAFLGIWELPIPGFIGEKAGHVQSQEGPAGAFLKGVLSTVLATPCSGPFLGPVFGFTLTQPTAVTYAVFGAIATGMALPYILVGLFPGLVRFLPRPGPWMATFKELLGFVMLGTVAYLFTFLHHDWFVPTFVLLVGIWMACWWVGRAQETTGAVGFGRWVQAALMATAIGTAAFLLLGPVKSLIEWEQPFSRARLAELRKAGATVMVDFSADWCPTCKFNLATAIETNRVRAAIEKNRVVPMLADWTDGSPEIKQMLESLDSKSIPVLAIFPAAKPGESPPPPIVLRDLITEPQVLDALERAGPSCCPPPTIRAAQLP